MPAAALLLLSTLAGAAVPWPTLRGAVTPDGKQAGYLFEKRVTPGVVRGITLWGR